MKSGFTLIELLVAVSIVGVLSSTVSSAVFNATKKTQNITTGQVKNTLSKAAQLYWVDMGFYPPDVNRGWDPGFAQKMPQNPDIALELIDPDADPGIDCGHCPGNWEEIVDRQWTGPYITKWPEQTPWGGRYDYNYWPEPRTRPNNCIVSPGIYVGAQANYSNDPETVVPPAAEQTLINLNLDDDGCVNAESQLLLHPL